MNKEITPPADGLRIDSVRPNRQRLSTAESLTMRIARGSQVIGNWSAIEIKNRLGSEDLLLTDLFYDQELSDWLPLSEFREKPALVKAEATVKRVCYCGTGLPFRVCCGDESVY